VSANLTGGAISNTLHVVTVSIPRCERGGAGANPAVGTFSSSCARQRAEPAVCNTALPSASLGRTSTFHRIRESQRTHLVWDQEAPGAAPGYPTISLVCSSAVEHQAHNLKRAGSNPAGPTISKQPRSSTSRASAFEAEGWWRKSTRGRHFHAQVVQRRDNRLRSGPVRVRVLPWAPLHAPVAQCIERRASNAEVEGENPSGNTISSRNVNRTSEPGLGANEIVPPPRGMRIMSSAFRHFTSPRMQRRRAAGPSNLS
jgi:hypothetical protein